MRTKLYTLLGFMTWEGIKLVVSRKLQQNRVKLGAAATVLLVVIGGLAIARGTASSDEG
jgi:hypothetical protein